MQALGTAARPVAIVAPKCLEPGRRAPLFCFQPIDWRDRLAGRKPKRPRRESWPVRAFGAILR